MNSKYKLGQTVYMVNFKGDYLKVCKVKVEQIRSDFNGTSYLLSNHKEVKQSEVFETLDEVLTYTSSIIIDKL